MIGMEELAQAFDDTFTQVSEFDGDADAVRLAGVDPDAATRFAMFKAESYENRLAGLIAAGTDLNEAIRLIIASAICDGLALGARAGRTEQRGREDRE